MNWEVNVLFLLLVTIMILYYFVTRDFDYWKVRNVPYLKPVPFVGNILPIIKQKQSIGQFMEFMYKESKRLKRGMLGFWICDKPCLFIDDLDIIKHILVKDFSHFADRVVASKSKNDPLGTNMIFGMKNPHWHNMRSRLSPLFTIGKIKQMFQYFTKNAENLNCYIDKVIKNTNNVELDVKNICGRYTADNLFEISIGTAGQCLTTEVGNDSYVWKIACSLTEDSPKRTFEFSTFFLAPEIVNWFDFKFFGEMASTSLRKIFWDAADYRIKSGEKGKREDLLDKLLNFKEEKLEMNGLKYDGDTLVSQFLVLFIAGFETSSTAIALTLHHLAWNPDIQNRLRDEIEKVKMQFNGKITYESLNEMTYLDMICKETLRLYPTLPFLDRLCIRDYQLPKSDLVIKKGTKLYLSLTGPQKDCEYWDNPDIFDPERFSVDNKDKIKPYTYMPFGIGPRICIGERVGVFQSKVGLATILSKYFIEKADATKEYPTISKLNPVTTPSPSIRLKFIYKPLNNM